MAEKKTPILAVSDNTAALNRILEGLDKELKGVSSGFLKLDAALNGGFHDAFYVVGGISSVGKTSFVLNVAHNIVKTGQQVRFYSLEMSTGELVGKLLSKESKKYSHTDFKTQVITGEDMENVSRAAEKLNDEIQTLEIIEGNFSTTIESIRHDLEKVKAELDALKMGCIFSENEAEILAKKMPVVIVDYLQILTTSSENCYTDKMKVDFVVSELKRISRDFKTPVIAIASLNRASYKISGDISSFKESGNIEYGCDAAILLEYEFIKGTKETEIKAKLEEQQAAQKRKIRAVIVKNRHGVQFNDRSIFDFYPKNNSFFEII